MSIEKVRSFFRQKGMEDRILEFEVSSATVALAAQALGCAEGKIAKTMAFHGNEKVMLLITAGDRKIDNRKYKEKFGVKAAMLKADELEPLVGHAVGGVCAFGIKEGIDVYLDESLKRFDTVYPAAGSANSAIELTMPELEKYSGSLEWVDVCKE